MSELSIDYSDIVYKLDRIESWLKNRNVETKNTRIDFLIRNVKLIEKAYKTDLKSLGNMSTEEFIFSLMDSYSFINIYEQFHNKPTNFIGSNKYREIIKEPFLSSEEISGSKNVNPRNFFFELELSAKLNQNGINVIGFDDLKFDFEKIIFLTECKRLFSEKNLSYNIKHATNQLYKKIKTSENGIIALSLEKIFKLDEKILRVNHFKDINKEIMKLSHKFISKNKEMLRSINNDRIVGYFLVFKFFAEVKQTRITPCTCFIIITYPICKKTNIAYKILINLGNTIKL